MKCGLVIKFIIELRFISRNQVGYFFLLNIQNPSPQLSGYSFKLAQPFR